MLKSKVFANFIGILCVAMFYFFFMFPIPFIILSVVIIIGFVIVNRTGILKTEHTANEEFRRKTALKSAQIYLSPYTNIWSNLKLSNKYCSLSLGYDGVTITCREKGEYYRSFRIINSRVHSVDDLWNMFCKNFDHTKTYEGLLKDCNLYKVTTIEEFVDLKKIEKIQQNKIEKLVNVQKEKIDINNASEVEITALPGISIVMAKKLIKKREEIGGFKNVEEVFAYLKIKPHIQKQLIPLICINKKKGTLKLEKYSERHVDL